MNDEKSYLQNDEEEKLLENLSDEDFITYMECLAIEINKRKEEV